MKNIRNYNYLKILLIIISILIAIPSIVFYIRHKTIAKFSGLEFRFLLSNNIDNGVQALVYLLVIIAFIIIYCLIIKHRKQLFENMKQIYIYILIISLIFVLVVPFLSSDIFYYLGIGRLSQKYGQNPYYTDIRSYVDNNNIDLNGDTVLRKGYYNAWGNTTCVYGAFWTMICGIAGFLSFGNIDLGILVYKLLTVLIHLGNCYLLYKISKKKIFTLIYGLNPFILLEGISNSHNDLLVIFLILLSLYFLLKKKNIVPSIICLALATDIKYFAVLLLPAFVLHYYKDKDLKTKIIKCLECGILFLFVLLLPYLLYIKDVSVFNGLITQQNKVSKGFYLIVYEIYHDNNGTDYVGAIRDSILLIFSFFFVLKCILWLLLNDKNYFTLKIRTLYKYILVFLFLLITCFQPWYLIWLTPFMIWQKSKNIRLIIQMQIMTLFANTVFFIYSEKTIYGVAFFAIYVIGVLLCYIYNKNNKKIKLYFKQRKCIN